MQLPELSHSAQLVLLGGSLAMALGTMALVPWLLVRMRADHFVRPPRRRSFAVHVMRNVLGGVLVLCGLAMLLLPGQGLVTILIGLSILDVPAKARATRWLLHRPRIAHAIQRLRARAGREPLLIP